MPQSGPQPATKALNESGALLVGGTSGVGLASAKALAQAGVPRIVVAGRDPERGAKAQQQIAALGASSLFLPTDALDPNAMSATVAQAEDFLQGVDIAVCTTAPRILPELFKNQEAGQVSTALSSLILPPMQMAHAVLPKMRERGHGTIINLASDAAKVATPGESVIGAAMAAIVMFTKTLAMEEKRHGVRANALTPSLINGTSLTDFLLADDFSERLFAGAIKRAALGVPDAEELAALVVFLSSPVAAKMTGQAISLNGGISAA